MPHSPPMSSSPTAAGVPPFRDLVGRFASLEVGRFGGPGAFLIQPGTDPEGDAILLLGAEVPPEARQGSQVEVFIALDSAGRPLATTAVPRLVLGEVAFLTVTACTEFGAFVDWGMPKELLVPFAEQTKEVRVGQRHAIGLYLDNTGRLAGTMRVSDKLSAGGFFQRDEWVEGEAWRDEPEIGLFVIVQKKFLALVPKHEPHGLSSGTAARFRVTHLHPDGKVELSLRGPAHMELEKDAETILSVLARPGARPIGDKSDPEEIRTRFGLSKKAFKRAVGTLLKAGRVDIDDAGLVHVLPAKRA